MEEYIDIMNILQKIRDICTIYHPPPLFFEASQV